MSKFIFASMFVSLVVGCGGASHDAPKLPTPTVRQCPANYQMHSFVQGIVSSTDRVGASAGGGLVQKSVSIEGEGEAIYNGTSTDEWFCILCPAGTAIDIEGNKARCAPFAQVSVADNSTVNGPVVGTNEGGTVIGTVVNPPPPPPPTCGSCQRWDAGANACVRAHRVTSCDEQQGCLDHEDGPACMGMSHAAQDAGCWSGPHDC